MKKSVFIFAILAFLSSSYLYGQNILKLSKARPVYYMPGNSISLQTKDGAKVSGQIQLIGNDYIIVDEQRITIKDIKTVYLERNRIGFFNQGLTLSTAGVGLLAISGINSLIINHTAVTPPSVYVYSAALFVGGIILFSLRVRRISMNEKHNLKIISPVAQ